MANRNFSQTQSLIKKQVVLAGFFNINSSAAITAQDFLGGTFSKTGAGQYTLTLSDKYQKLLGASVLVAESSENLVGDLGTADVANTKQIQVLTVNAGAATDATAPAKIYVTLILSNSSVN